MKYDFGIRIDLGLDVGSGHFFRCLAIMNNLVSKNKTVIFLINDKKEFLKFFENEIPPYVEIGKNGVLEDIVKCKKYLNKFSKLIVDLPFDNELYSQKFENICKVAIIDDLGNKKISSEVLFNGSIVNRFHNYEIDKKNTKIFLNGDFMILRSNIIGYRKMYTISPHRIQNILITFGGSDNRELTKQILSKVKFSKYTVNILIGPSFNDLKSLQEIIKNKSNITLIQSTHDVGNLFVKQDLVISSSGITAYELALLGVPTIFIPSEKQK